MNWNKADNKFTTQFVVRDNELEFYDYRLDDYIDKLKINAAADLGAEIGKKYIDAWEQSKDKMIFATTYQLKLYVFTPEQMYDLERHYRALERGDSEEKQ